MLLDRINSCDEHVASICSSWDNWIPDGSINGGEDNPARSIELIPGDVCAVIGTLMRGCWWHISGCAIRLKAFQEIGGFDPGMPQLGDWDWLLRCLAAGWSVEYVPRSLVLYRQHSKSVSSASFSMDHDIRESLAIIDRYSHLLGRTELLQWHIRRSAFCIRRLARALARLDFSRIYLSLQTMALVFQGYLRVESGVGKRRLSRIRC